MTAFGKVALVPLAAVAALGGLVVSSAQEISKADVEMSLISELVGLVGKDGQGELEAVLQPHFEPSPKDAGGALQPQAARDVLHRYFVQRRGWFVKGLAEPRGGESAGEGWVPTYLLDLLEPRLAGKGVGIRELAALAAVLEGLVRKEAEARVVKAYETLSLPTEGRLGEQDAVAVVRSYLADYVRSGSEDLPEGAQELLRRVGGSLSDLSAKGALDLPNLQRVAAAIGEQYGHFHKRQCRVDAVPQCLEASHLYAICCREELAQAADDSLAVATPAVVLCGLAMFAASLRHLLAAGSVGGSDAEAEDDLKKPAPAVSTRPAWAGMALSLLIAVAFALQLLDATVLAGAMVAGLLLLTGVRVAPRETGAKSKES